MTNPKATMLGMLGGIVVHFITILILGKGATTLGGVVMAAAAIASSVTRAECEHRHRLER